MRDIVTCPNCGARLDQVEAGVGGRDTAPLLCSACSRGWWQAEVTPAAKALWNPRTACFGHGQEASALRASVAAERASQQVHGRAAIATGNAEAV